jgi:hypothetical protein
MQNYDQYNVVLSGSNHRDECTRCSEIAGSLQTMMEELKPTQLIIKMLHDEINQLNASSYVNSSERSNDTESSANERNTVEHKHLRKMRKFATYPTDNNIKLTPWSRVLPEKLKCPKLLKEFPAFYGTRRCITVYTRARHLSLA